MMKIHSMKLSNAQNFPLASLAGQLLPPSGARRRPASRGPSYTVFPMSFSGPRDMSYVKPDNWVVFGTDSVQIYCVLRCVFAAVGSVAVESFFWADFRAMLGKNWQKTYRVCRMFWSVLRRAVRHCRGCCVLSREAGGNPYPVSRSLHYKAGVFCVQRRLVEFVSQNVAPRGLRHARRKLLRKFLYKLRA